MPEAGTRSSLLFAALAGSPLPISILCRQSVGLRVQSGGSIILSPVQSSRHGTSAFLPLVCVRRGVLGAAPIRQRERLELLAPLNFSAPPCDSPPSTSPSPFFWRLPSALNRFPSHCLLCACHPARNDFPSICGGLFLARVVDYPSALHCLPQASLITSAALFLSTTLSPLSLIHLVFDRHNDQCKLFCDSDRQPAAAISNPFPSATRC